MANGLSGDRSGWGLRGIGRVSWLCATGLLWAACSGQAGEAGSGAGAAEGEQGQGSQPGQTGAADGSEGAAAGAGSSGSGAGSVAAGQGEGSTAGDGSGSSGQTGTTGSDVTAGDGSASGTAGGTSAGGTDGSSAGGTDGATETSPGAAADCGVADVGSSVLRRLTRIEMQLTLQELFALGETPLLVSVPQDSDFKGFRTLSELQNVTTEHLRAYEEEATTLAEQLLADPARADRVIGCDVAAAGCLESFITDFGRVAYRRSLGPDDVGALLDVAAGAGGSAEEQFTAVVAAMLSSASFLFRAEIGDATEGLSTLSGEELASRLSFALIGRGPSRELLDAGAAGELDTEAGLVAAAQQLLSDDRAEQYFTAFFKQWLGFEQLRAPNDPAPDWNDAIMLSMTEETERFLNEFAWAPGMNFLDSITANHSYIRADLAEFYGLPAPAANGRVEFPAGHDRHNSGLLTHAALISAKGDGDRIAHRGAWVQKTFLCLDLVVPTALLDEISDELEGLTYQQMLDKRNSEAACAGCHAMIDPIGVGFSQYDASGKFDARVDPMQYGITPGLPGGQAFSSIGELSTQLRARAETVAQCLTDKVFLYTDGRQPENVDACALEQAAQRFAGDQYRFASILEGLVTSPRFRLRRAPEVTQ